MTDAMVMNGPAKPNRANPLNQRVARILKGTATFEDRFVPNHKELVEIIAHLRSMGAVIVFTTGVWDLFHLGHSEYIRHGKEEGRKLYPNAEHVVMVVGVDTDALTKLRKGPTRPIVPEDERWQVLAELRSVDLITPQYEPNQLYKLVDHDVRVISTSTKDLPTDIKDIQAQCERLVNLPPQAETSTTARVRRLAMDGKLETLSKFKERLSSLLEEVANELDS